MADPVTVAISKLMEAKAGDEWTYDEFKMGCAKAGADTIPAWKTAVPKQQQKLEKDEDWFTQVYKHAFIIS